MKEKILEKLKQTEREYNIEILFACESGSRAWGFESPDSDWDIRFIYIHKENWYLNLWEQKDTIQFMTNDLLDGSGWDLRKSLKLLAKSNASFLSWLYSPIVYINKGFLTEIRQLAEDNFSPVAVFHHYHSMSKQFSLIENQEKVNLKKLFYALRTSLSARWVLEYKTTPPVEFKKLLVLLSEKEINWINQALAIKKTVGEKDDHMVSGDLIKLVTDQIEINERNKGEAKSEKANYDDFNTFFLKKMKK